MKEKAVKYIASSPFVIWAFFKPSISYILVTLLFIIIDNITAWRLNKRLKKKYPNKVKNSKYSSLKASKMLKTIGNMLSWILVSWVVDQCIVKDLTDFRLTASVAMLFCFVQFLSILENITTENDNKIMKRFYGIIQKFVVDKSERYFDMDLNGDKKIGDSNDDKQN